MADPGIYAFSIRKSRGWRGQNQGFSNLYHYSIAAPTEQGLGEILDKLKALEAAVHDTGASFVEGRAWGPVQPNGRGGRMEAVKVFTGAGALSENSLLYKETALLLYWPLGRYGSKNRPQFIRKWLHSLNTALTSVAGENGNTDLGTASSTLNTYMAGVQQLVPVVGQTPLDLKTASGHIPIGNGQLYKFREHRQYGR